MSNGKKLWLHGNELSYPMTNIKLNNIEHIWGLSLEAALMDKPAKPGTSLKEDQPGETKDSKDFLSEKTSDANQCSKVCPMSSHFKVTLCVDRFKVRLGSVSFLLQTQVSYVFPCMLEILSSHVNSGCEPTSTTLRLGCQSHPKP